MWFNQIVSVIALFTSLAVTALPPGYYQPPRVAGRQFFLNGKVQRFSGINAWWLCMLRNSQSGIQVVRVWALGNSNVNTTSSIYYQLIQSTGTSINYGPNGIGRLDAAIKYAEKYGLKLVLPMMNNWDALGGVNTYCAAFGCNATTFYTNERAQAAYRGWVKFVINRYKNSPAIFAWELMNEPQCRQCPTSVITNWAISASQYVKSLDPHHMVTLGDEGWFADHTYGDGSYPYSGYNGINFLDNIKIKTLDYAIFHLYPGFWNKSNSWGNDWIAQHADAGKRAGKPVVLEEYGCVENTESARAACNNQWQATVRSSGIAVDQIWQFATVLPTAGTSLYDNFAVYYNTTKGSLYDVVVIQNVKRMAKAPLLY